MLLLLLALGMDPAPIAMSSTFRFGFEPADIHIRLTIQPNPLNRAVCLAYDGDNKASESCWEVDETSPVITQRTLKQLPSGDYLVIARLYRADKTTHDARLELQVLSSRE